MKQTSDRFLAAAHEHMENTTLRAHMDGLGQLLPLGRDAAMEQLGNFEDLRAHVCAVKDHTLNNLDYYLGRYEENVIQRGGKVHWASNGDDLNRIVGKSVV